MRISSLETIPVALPFRERYLTSTGSLDAREMLVVRLTGPDGLVGWGDAVPMSLRGGDRLREVAADIEACGTVLAGADFDRLADVSGLVAACGRSGAGRQALAGVEMALLDLLGRARDLPLWKILGAERAEPVPCNGTLGAGEPDAVAVAAAELASSGFETLKVKVGTGRDGERIRAVREAAGPDVALRLDANGAWDVPTAESTLGDLGDLGIELAEQPCASVGELAALRNLTAVPIVADESAGTAAEAEDAFAAGACDAVTIKLAKVGGIESAVAVAAAAPAYLSSALDSALGIAAAAHAAQVLPATGFAAGLAHGLATSGLFADNVADDQALRGPSIDPPTGPGLGVEVDETAIERLRIR
jgi:L-alanine-DL-glutamate epimerase-like enolase superfamily enzyme